ncbi:MAG: hypothetical protein JO334_08965 [Verrucomicrobia bacterium]|nr:hypothetical protein [Verrucomicrobiota bacterium]
MPKIPERVGLDSGANVHAVLTEDGTKELFAVVDDYREIAQSQRELLQHLKRTVDIVKWRVSHERIPLIYRSVESPKPSRTVIAIWRKDREHTCAASGFLNHLRRTALAT